MNSPPYSSSEASLSPHYPQYPINPNLRSLLASTWNVLDQPPPPSLREILAAYKQKGDGDREMLLAMLNAKSAEDQRIASMASLRRTVLDISQATELTPPPHISHSNVTHYAAPGHNSPQLTYNQYGPPSASYTPPVHHQQILYSPPVAHAHLRESPSTSSQTSSLPSIRLRPSGSNPGSGPSELQSRRKRARRSQSPNGVPRLAAAHSHGHAHLHTTSAEQQQQQQQQREFPPSPYSSARSSVRERSMSEDSNSQAAQQRERGSMAIGSLLSGGASRVKSEVERDDAWVPQRERRDSRGEPSRSSDAP